VLFPGQRVAKHYFPVSRKATRLRPLRPGARETLYLLGLDQPLVDVEVWDAPPTLLEEIGLLPGESILLDSQGYRHLLERISVLELQTTLSPGGAVGNTLNNYTHLSGEPALLLGALPDGLRVGDPAFQYVSKTSPAVDLRYTVSGGTGSVATALTFIGADGERSFAVYPGVANSFPPEAISQRLVEDAAAVLTTLYCLRNPEWPIARAAVRMMDLARSADVPVALGLGTASLVAEQREATRALLVQYVTLAAMNQNEARALTGEADALLACRQILEWVDVVIITEGARGLTMGGYVDDGQKRQTREGIRSKSIVEYNRWEFSRLMRRRDCDKALKIYTHIHPYQGGPSELGNTNGAGDAALAAVLHDVAANHYHRQVVPSSHKHKARFLTYSSLSRNAQYGNRVAYEVLRGRSPRLVGPVGPDEEPET